MLAIATTTIRPLIEYHILRLPMTSNAPVPVYSRTKKPCFGASARHVLEVGRLDGAGFGHVG